MRSDSVAFAGDVFARYAREWRSASLQRRPRDELPFDHGIVAADRPIMLDTTVYFDALQKRLPVAIATLLSSRIVLHSSVASAEIALSAAHLRPDHPSTPRNRLALQRELDDMRLEKLVSPGAASWIEAAILSGIVARLQGRAEADRRALLNDALLLLSSLETGAVLISRNIMDMDFLMQLRPGATVLLYDRETA